MLENEKNDFLICKICFDNKAKPLQHCVIFCNNYSVSNLSKHLKSQHGNDARATSALAKQRENEEKKRRPVSGDAASISANSSSISSHFLHGFRHVQRVGAQYLYAYLTSANVAYRHASSKYLEQYVDHLLKNAKLYRDKGVRSALLTQHRFQTQRDVSFANFVLALKQLVAKCRSFYCETIGNEIPFLAVAHDGWDSVDHDILGVSLHFVDPEDWMMIKVAIGLKVLEKGKTAVEQASQINEILLR